MIEYLTSTIEIPVWEAVILILVIIDYVCGD